MYISKTRIKKLWKNKIGGFNFIKQYIKARLLKLKQIETPKNLLIQNILNLKLFEDNFFSYVNNEEIIRRADKILNCTFTIFNKDIIIDKIDWNYDYLNNITIPKKFYFDLREDIVQNKNRNFDAKNIWELSRGDYLMDLAVAFILSKNVNYITKYKNITTNWINSNEFLYGVNYTNPMEVGLRLINYILSYQMLLAYVDDQFFDNEFNDMLKNHLWQCYIYLQNNLETYPFKSNHYIIDNVALFLVSLMFNKEERTNKWIKKSLNNLTKELETEFDQDGVDFENSTNYQALKAEGLGLVALLCDLNQVKGLEKAHLSRVESVLKTGLLFVKPDNTLCAFGDNDETQIIKTMSASNVMKWLSKNLFETTFDMFTSTILQNSGYCMLKNNDYYISFGRKNIKDSSHFHNDLLSFQLNYRGLDYFVDSNTFNYNIDNDKRYQYLSTASHNTCFINTFEQSKISLMDPFFRNKQVKVDLTKNDMNSEFDSVGLKIKYPLFNHERIIKLNKKNNKFVIFDLINGNNIKTIEWNFYLDKDVTLDTSLKDKNTLLLRRGQDCLIMEFSKDLILNILKANISNNYNNEIETTRIKLTYVNIQNSKDLKFQLTLKDKYEDSNL